MLDNNDLALGDAKDSYKLLLFNRVLRLIQHS